MFGSVGHARMRMTVGIFCVLLAPVSVKADILDSSTPLKAEKGDVCAQANMGSYYSAGTKKNERNDPAAIEWYRKAIEGRCADGRMDCLCQLEAMHSLARLYERKEPPERKKAFELYRRAAEKGFNPSYKKLAEYYLEGGIFGPDYKNAYYWLKMHSPSGRGMEEIKSRLSQRTIEKIDERVRRKQEELQANGAKRLNGLLNSVSGAFVPAVPEKERANKRLSFELGQNGLGYDLDGIKKLIGRGALAPSNDDTGSFLFAAQKAGDPELVKLLIENGADINATDERGFTVLHRSLGYKNTDIALELIKAGIDLTPVNDLGETALMQAAGSGNTAVVNALIAAGADVNQHGSNEYGGDDALYKALHSRNYDIADILIKAGAKQGDVHNQLERRPAPQGRCAIEKKTCEDGTRVPRVPPSCDFEACPVKDAQTPAPEKIPGTFSEIQDTKAWDAARILSKKGGEGKEAVIKDIRENPGDYPPYALSALAAVLFGRIEDEEAAFWFLAAQLRARYDVKVCGESKGGMPWIFSAHFKPYAQANPGAVEKLIERAVAWDRETPYNYDQRWVNIFSGRNGHQLQDKIPDGLCAPEAERPKLKEESVRLFVSGMANETVRYGEQPELKKPR